MLEWTVRRRLRRGPSGASAVKVEKPAAAVETELPEKTDFDGAVLSKKRPNVTVKDAVVSFQIYSQSYEVGALTTHVLDELGLASGLPSRLHQVIHVKCTLWTDQRPAQ